MSRVQLKDTPYSIEILWLIPWIQQGQHVANAFELFWKFLFKIEQSSASRLFLFYYPVLIDAETADPNVGPFWIEFVLGAKIQNSIHNISNAVADLEEIPGDKICQTSASGPLLHQTGILYTSVLTSRNNSAYVLQLLHDPFLANSEHMQPLASHPGDTWSKHPSF